MGLGRENVPIVRPSHQKEIQPFQGVSYLGIEGWTVSRINDNEKRTLDLIWGGIVAVPDVPQSEVIIDIPVEKRSIPRQPK